MTSIGGNLETSIYLDASGVRTGADRSIEAMQSIELGAERLGDTLGDISGRSQVMTDSLERAASMVELLSAKMLSAERKMANMRNGGGGLSFGDRMSSTQPTFGDRMAGVSGEATRANMDRIAAEERRSQQERLSQAERFWAQWEAEEAGFLQRIHNEVAKERATEMAALAADIQARLNLQQRYRTQWEAEQAGFLQRMHNEVAQERSQEMAALAANIQARLNLQQRYRTQWEAEQVTADQRLRQDAEEQRAMELAALRNDIEQRARLQNEAAEDERQRAENRVRTAFRIQQRYQLDAERFRAGSGPDQLRTSQSTISNNFRDVARQAVEWERGRTASEAVEQSMRRMRGMANPLVQMEQRLADESREFAQNLQLAVQQGFVLQNQADAMTAEFMQQNALLMQQAREQNQGFLGMRRMGFAAQQFGYAIEDAASMWGTMGASGAFRAGANNLTAMAATMGPAVGVAASLGAAAAAIGLHWYESAQAAEEAADSQEEILKIEERILETQQRLIETTTRLNELRAAGTRQTFGSALSEQMTSAREAEANAATEAAMAPIRDAEARLAAVTDRLNTMGPMPMASGPMGAAGSADFQRRQTEYVNERVALLEEQKRLQQDITQMQERAAEADQINNSEGRKAQERQRERIDGLARSQELYQQRLEEINNPDRQESFADIEREIRDLQMERNDLLEGAYNSETDLIAALQQQEELMDRQLEAQERLARLRREQEDQEQNLNQSLYSRFESVNENMRFENEMTRQRLKMQEQLQELTNSGQIGPGEAAQYQNDIQRIEQIERENRQIDQNVKALREREQKVEQALAAQTPSTVMGATFGGTDEANRIIENERMRIRQQAENQPVVDELKGIRQEITRQRQQQERNAQAAPNVAVMF